MPQGAWAICHIVSRSVDSVQAASSPFSSTMAMADAPESDSDSCPSNMCSDPPRQLVGQRLVSLLDVHEVSPSPARRVTDVEKKHLGLSKITGSKDVENSDGGEQCSEGSSVEAHDFCAGGRSGE